MTKRKKDRQYNDQKIKDSNIMTKRKRTGNIMTKRLKDRQYNDEKKKDR